ncbi:MAG: ABC transporter permease [Chitinophagaceae bacterium]
MIKNYFTVAFRSLWRNKTFTAINITGLAIGLAVFLLIFQYIGFEWSANRFHQHYDRLYRLGAVGKTGDQNYHFAPGLSTPVVQKLPAVESFVRVADGLGSGVLSVLDNGVAGNGFREENISYTDGSFFSAFSFTILDGTPVLDQPQAMAISENTSVKLFGTTKAAGKVIKVSNQFGNTDYTVSAVFKNPPAGSDLKPEVLLSFNTLATAANRNENDWADPATLENGFVASYVLLKKGANPTEAAAGVTQLIHSLQPDEKDQTAFLQPFSEVHLAPAFDYPYQTYGSLKLVVMLFAVALLILLIAWVNYINLSTVQALKRAKETGVRKVLGASRKQLTVQYLSETFLLTLVSIGLSLFIVQFAQGLFNKFTGKELSLTVLNQGWFWAGAITCVVVGALLAGGYVAFVLSSFKPVAAIKGRASLNPRGFSLRKGLVVFQFSISVVFIIATIVLYQQLEYMKGGNLGMNLDQLLVIKGPTVSSEEQAEKNDAFKNQLARLPFVQKYAGSNNVPGKGYNFSTANITRLNPSTGDEKKSYSMFISDDKFFDTYDISFVQGKAFTAEEAMKAWMNAKKVLVNEKAASQLGFAKGAQVAGQKILWSGKEYEIGGVVKDYHHLSLHQPIDPVIFLPSTSFVYFTVKTGTDNLQSKLSTLNGLYKQYFPGNPFEYFFADDTFDRQYASEQQLGNVFVGAAVIAVLIACMGLFGLAAFSAQQRTREIGIRKVLGASVGNITTMLSRDFVKLVLISVCIASPLAWWGLHNWLKDFAYRVSIGWWVFAMAAAIALLIAVMTVSIQAIRAAVINPVKSLRSE